MLAIFTSLERQIPTQHNLYNVFLFHLPYQLVFEGPVYRTRKRPENRLDWTGKDWKSVRSFRNFYNQDCKRPVLHCHILFLPTAIKVNQKSSKSDENWVKYDQNRVNCVKNTPLTQFWSHLTQFSPNLLDLWFIFMAGYWRKLRTNDLV